MPYRLSGNCVQVQRANRWRNLKCHPTHDRAVAHLRALEANVSDQHKDMGEYKLDQSEVGYIALSTADSQACANCRWFMPDIVDKCHLVKCEPEPILATGWCDRWELRAVEIEEPEIEEENSGMMETITADEEMGLMALGKAIMRRLRGANADEGFAVFKGHDGKRYWLAKYTNNFKDRENEYFTDSAHDEYVKRVTSGEYPMPELWTYHTRNTRHGEAVHIWKSGGFVMALGVFDDTPEARKAYDFYSRNRGKIKLSHGFYYPSSAKIDGVYHQYRTFEISTLPAGVEANPYTDFQELKPMALSEHVRAWIQEVGGESMLKRVETLDKQSSQDTDALKAQGVDYKGLGLPTDDEAFKALRTDYDKLATKLAEVQGELATAKETEAAAKQLIALLNPLTTLADSNEATQKALTAILQKQAEIDLKLAAYADLQPPASKSEDTILAQREVSFLGAIVNESKSQDGGQSFLDRVLGQTAITES